MSPCEPQLLWGTEIQTFWILRYEGLQLGVVCSITAITNENETDELSVPAYRFNTSPEIIQRGMGAG
jgi:hypothetical protein